MPRYRITSLREGFVDVEAPDWLSGLSAGMRELGLNEGLTHMAAETLPGGKILIRDVRSGAAYSIFDLASSDPAEVTEGELLPLDEDEITGSGEVEDLADMVMLAPSVEDATQEALSALQKIVPSASGSILRADSQGWLQFVAFFGPGSEQLGGMSLPPDTGVAGFCVREAKSLTLREAWADERFFKQIDRFTRTTTKTLLCVPLVHGGVAYGCIELLNVVGGSFETEMLADADRIAQALGARFAREPLPAPSGTRGG